ncbi:MAG: GUN4 domain-containing protein [Crocosphaera sp.]|nr:GUN4 domain-containing protein [Crocosphaera sp.]
MTEEPKKDPQLSQQLTDALIKLIVVGSGGSSLYFLFTDSIPKALIAGVIATGASLLTNFWEGVIGVLKPRSKSLGEATGKAIDRSLSGLTSQFSNFQELYLESLKTYCYGLEIEGFQDLPGLALKDVFVPLNVQSKDGIIQQGFKEIWDFLPSQQAVKSPHRRIIVIADPGFGKTTLMRHLAYAYTIGNYRNTKYFIPILLRFRDIYSQIRLTKPESESNDNNFIDLISLIIAHLEKQPEFKDLKPDQQWLRKNLKDGNCLVIFDGLDEVPKGQRETIRRWTDSVMKEYKNTQFILTSRPHGFELNANQPSYPISYDLKLRIREFTNDQKEEFINKWYRTIMWEIIWKPRYQRSLTDPPNQQLTKKVTRIRSDKEATENAEDLFKQLFANLAFNDLARNPLLITMIAVTHRSEKTLPTEREELYRKITDLLLSTRPHHKNTLLTLNAKNNKIILQVLAFCLMETEETTFTPKQGIEWIESTIKDCCSENQSLTGQKFLTEMLEITGLLQERELDTYEFSHLTFQEYFAALHLKELGNEGQEKVIERLEDEKWEEVIYFYLTLTDATPIITAILNNPTSYTLSLANKCKLSARLKASVRQELNQMLLERREEYENISAAITLEQRFNNLTIIDEKTAISNPITWREYKLFLDAQTSGQFHSTAEVINITDNMVNQPVTGIKWEDARWFCGWLATQQALQSSEAVYDHRLPTADETSQLVPKGITENSQDTGDCLRVVRVIIPSRYQTLLNYLSSGRWKDADGETAKVMLQVANRVEEQYLRVEDIDNFPCEDLRIIDQLWVKYSNGRFGFSVQKKIYMDELGGTRDYNEKIWYEFCDRVGWSVGGDWVNYSDLVWEYKHTTPIAQLPMELWLKDVDRGIVSSLAHRLVSCSVSPSQPFVKS